jgi:hypothetical protein
VSKKRRQFVVLGPARSGGGNEHLGRIAEVRAVLARTNTSADGAGASGGIERLHGPGFTIDLPTSNDSVTQLIASLHDESYAWPVLEKLCRGNGWMLMDMESGRTLAFTA